MYKKGRVNSNSRIISTDEDPSLRIESSAIINLRGVSTKLDKYSCVFVSKDSKYYLIHENECFIIFKTPGAAERFRYDKTRLFECIK